MLTPNLEVSRLSVSSWHTPLQLTAIVGGSLVKIDRRCRLEMQGDILSPCPRGSRQSPAQRSLREIPAGSGQWPVTDKAWLAHEVNLRPTHIHFVVIDHHVPGLPCRTASKVRSMPGEDQRAGLPPGEWREEN